KLKLVSAPWVLPTVMTPTVGLAVGLERLYTRPCGTGVVLSILSTSAAPLFTLTGVPAVQISSSRRPVALLPVAGVNTNMTLTAFAVAPALKVVQPLGNLVRFRFSRPAIV